MRFNTEPERMAHPEACLIPKRVWFDEALFNGEISDNHLKVMRSASQHGDEAIAEFDDVFLQSLGTESQKETAWLALAYSHPGIAPDVLIHFAERLDLKVEQVFKLSAILDHQTLLETLVAAYPAQLQRMIRDGGYFVFRRAAFNGHLSLMKFLMNHVSEDEQENMILAMDFGAFRNAAYNGYFDVMAYLIERVPEDELQEMISVENFAAFRNAAEQGHSAVVERLLVLLSPEQQSILTERLLEAFRTAVRHGDHAVAQVFLMFEVVYERARANNFYQREARGSLNLETLVRDRESSMTALSRGEQKRLEEVRQIYEPKVMRLGGPLVVVQALRDKLKARYEGLPAKVVTENGHVLVLPFGWDDWCALSSELSPNLRKQACEAYYQHEDHTAWRYLSKPNPWMAEDAPYVNRSNIGGWSTFEKYQPLIAMFYLGVMDEEIQPCDGHTFASRLTYFITELASIGRAHNWDKKRVKQDTSGSPCFNKQGEEITEEYDDLEGDKPSCYSGVKRRLFQSVQGHPMFKILTLDDIKQELRAFVREQFKQAIQKDPIQACQWKQAWDTVCETGMGGERLAEMNVSEEAQMAFLEALREKYPSQFDEDPSFNVYIQGCFQLNEQVTTHAARFGGEVDLVALLAPCGQLETRQGRRHGMFDTTSPTPSTEDKRSNDPHR
ncbi:MAG: hypothetical protein P1U39_05825 [Legionellaceae bacterium]|nr:hypothetical protein [Legionellaceae bacterium]